MATEPATSTIPRLQVEDPAGSRVVVIERRPFTIGRRSANDLVLMDPDVSRDHVEIVEHEGGLLLKDRASRFGTFVNGFQVSEHQLAPNDRITFGRGGRTEIVFLSGDGASATLSGAGFGSDLRQIALLLEALRGMGSGRVLDEVLALVLDSAIEVSGAERGFIMLANPEGVLEMKLARAQGKFTLPQTGFAISRKIPDEVFLTGRVREVRDLRDLPVRGDGTEADDHGQTIALGIRHILCTPLRLVRIVDRQDKPADERNIGVLYLDSRERGKFLSGMARAALEAMASEAASAIENARLYRETQEKVRIEQELRTAAQIQQALLPPPHKLGAFFEAVGSSVPCRAVGGDFFEYFAPPDGGFAFALGDVAGKGPPAALLAAVLQGILTGQAYSAVEPFEVMTRINNALLARGVESRFATAFYGHLSPEGVLTYCNAGHNPPLVFGADGVRRLEVGGMIVGLIPFATYEQDKVQLSPGDIVVVFSDGVTEAVNTSGEEFEEDRIREVVEPIRTDSIQKVQAALLRSVRDFSQGLSQSDDITVLVVGYRPQTAPVS
jgi:sigma-B regulation protein RsbU (phosphoserine phosphatase)